MRFLSAAAFILFAWPANAATSQFALQSNLDHVWTMTAAALVFFMQAGFLLLEAGQVRSKNSVNVAQKNLVDFILSTVAFGLVGFALMFGTSQGGFWGWDDRLAVFGAADNWSMTFFVFQLVFCGTAATILSGAVAERMNMRGYILCTLLLSLLIYPVAGHWAWGGLLTGDETPYLAAKGFMDFAGSTVVHSVGAWVGLAAIVVIGPRFGKYDENGKARQLHGHSPILATAGCVILWVGWIGFNGGSTTAGTEDFSVIVMNTMVSAAAGGVAAMLLGRLVSGLFRPTDSINGVLAGLVGITAGCDAVTAQNAFYIGAGGAVFAFGAAKLLEHVLRLDDPLHAVAVHGAGGVWGTVMVGVFAEPEKLLAADRTAQIMVQLEGAGMVFAWAFGVSIVVLKVFDMMLTTGPDGGSGLRVSEAHEREGLNIAEHGAPLGTGVLQGAMARMASDPEAEFAPVEVDHGDEAYEMSLLFNRIVENENRKRDEMAARDAERQKAAMEKAVADLLSSEIGTVIEENARGNYRSRVPLEGKDGVMLDLARTINKLSESTADSLESVRSALRGFLDGDLDARIDGQYEGMLADIQADVNGTIGQLREAMQAMDGTVAAASAGDFSPRIDLEGKTGVLAGLCQGLNQINEVCEAGLGDLQRALTALANGDLTARMTHDHEGQFAEIRDVLHRTISELNEMVGAIAASAGQVAQAGSDVSGISETMGDTARTQAGLMETAARVLSDLSETSRTNTERATEARERCDGVRAKAEQGHGTAAQATEHMDLVRDAAREIAEAIQQIEVIAKQTKLLALNASVEAVRGGGDASRSGFQVVAQEVRALALRTQEAAVSVREKADHVAEEIVHGQELVEATSDGLREIVEAASASADLVRDVARSGEEQNARIGEGDTSVTRASQAASESLRQVETCQDTAQVLTESAARTRALLDRFDLGEDEARRVA